MSRPGVSVVMPFSGSAEQARTALATLRALRTRAGDELILVDNCAGVRNAPAPVRVVAATGERSPAHARNVGAAEAQRDWILFLDADCRAPADLLDRFLADAVAADVGALAGAVVAASAGESGVAARYGSARNFLGHEAHLAHPYMPRAVAANLMVRREAFAAVSGFMEGLRAAEDTDFTWRLQRAGWKLAARPQAVVQHSYRTSVRELRRQWRGYAAGRAWLARRYDGFVPEPAMRRAARRLLARGGRTSPRGGHTPRRPGTAPRPAPDRVTRVQFAALDAVLGVEELVGLALSNRPARDRGSPARVVLVADRFPAVGDPLVEFARRLAGARVEAGVRPASIDREAASQLTVDYAEDDGALARALALGGLVVRHPLRCARDAAGRLVTGSAEPGLAALAPAVARLRGEPEARIRALGSGGAGRTAERLARLSGRAIDR